MISRLIALPVFWVLLQVFSLFGAGLSWILMEVKISARDPSPNVDDNVNRSNVDACEAKIWRYRNVNTQKRQVRARDRGICEAFQGEVQ